ncbi:helix-turn-helix transcriptional regulator [Tychonema sp. LEGE 07203]|uniref:helix-turn-helix transcriptional regulator n=1 Tax=Tychonema sp. LEGE 07203 TaxID=1828671 RepID=UPI001881034E|nr:AraC family transcriptional regulator [Tychonema sp. LEGE 07203]MBE9097766.1 helix-turn-helix transcriptional regulator [Tychonema sp. LEGE 07203]
MSPQKPLILDFAKTDAMKVILPRPAILSSYGAKWQGIHVEYHCQPPNECPEHCLEQHTIGLMLNSATLKGTLNGKHCGSESWQSGQMFVAAAGTYFEAVTTEYYEFMAIALEPTDFENTVCESIDSNPIEIIPQWQTRDPLIRGIAWALKTELESGGLNGTLYVDALKNALSLHVLHRYGAQKPNLPDVGGGLAPGQLQVVIHYINEFINRDLHLSELANLVKLSSYHFSRMFKQSTGVTPHQYVTQCRIEKAKQLLKKPELSIKYISQQVGFHDQSHFSKTFSKIVGVTPKKYRDRL